MGSKAKQPVAESAGTLSMGEVTHRVQIEVPEEADDAVIKALEAVGTALGAESEVSVTAPPHSYSLTIHVFAKEA